MKTWSPIVALLGVLVLFFLLIVFYKTDTMMERDFENIRLRYAVDYASAAAFQSTLEAEDIGLDYTDLDSVTINPTTCLDTFKSLMCLSYGMSMSAENFALLENYIPTAVLATNDGYYIASMQEIDTTPMDTTKGGEYKLTWSLKKPYAIERGNTLYATNLANESWTSVEDSSSGGVVIQQGDTYEGGIDAKEIIKAVNHKISGDISYIVRERNKVSNKIGLDNLFFSPSEVTQSGINAITKPTLLIMMQGVDFAGSQQLSTVSVGGFKTIHKSVVLGFTDVDGIKYYCYEHQATPEQLDNAEDFFNSVEEASQAGYYPHYINLSKPRDL